MITRLTEGRHGAPLGQKQIRRKQRMSHFIGIDVGTGSARAGVFDAAGRMLASAKRQIAIWHEAGEIVEQSSSDIWRAVTQSVREAVAASGVAPDAITGIGIDATCSLVAVDASGEPVAVGPSGDPDRNIIVWMDHRAIDQARRINATGHRVLSYVGGVISPEMETPKLLWLAEQLPESFARAAHFFDLADWLTFRATGSLTRSTCTLTCKWTYLAHERRFDEGYFRQNGLGVLADEGFARIGTHVVEPGTPIGGGLDAGGGGAKEPPSRRFILSECQGVRGRPPDWSFPTLLDEPLHLIPAWLDEVDAHPAHHRQGVGQLRLAHRLRRGRDVDRPDFGRGDRLGPRLLPRLRRGDLGQADDGVLVVEPEPFPVLAEFSEGHHVRFLLDGVLEMQTF